MLVQIDPIEGDIALDLLVETTNGIHQSGLAGTGTTDDGYKLIAANMTIDMVEDLPMLLADVLIHIHHIYGNTLHGVFIKEGPIAIDQGTVQDPDDILLLQFYSSMDGYAIQKGTIHTIAVKEDGSASLIANGRMHSGDPRMSKDDLIGFITADGRITLL